MATPIVKVPGIGAVTAEILQEHGFKTAEDVAAAPVARLTDVPGFGAVRAAQVIAAARALTGDAGSKAKAKKPKAALKAADKKTKKKRKKKAEKISGKKAKAEKASGKKKAKKKKNKKKTKK